MINRFFYIGTKLHENYSISKRIKFQKALMAIIRKMLVMIFAPVLIDAKNNS
jgi:hypothetical protein